MAYKSSSSKCLPISPDLQNIPPPPGVHLLSTCSNLFQNIFPLELTASAVKYLSNATSTCILQCSREHYRLVWAALTMMDRVPTKHGPGKPCIVRVVRVSGTIKKVEQEAVRRARLLILAAKDEMPGKGSDALGSLFGSKDSASEVAMVDVDEEFDSRADFDSDD